MLIEIDIEMDYGHAILKTILICQNPDAPLYSGSAQWFTGMHRDTRGCTGMHKGAHNIALAHRDAQGSTGLHGDAP